MRPKVFSIVVVVLAGLVLGAAPASARPVDSAVAAAGAPGQYAVASTTSVGPCVGPVADKQTRDNRRDGVTAPIQCTGAFPIGTGPDTGVNFYYPSNASSPRPLVAFNGGLGANPGFFDRTARHWASHGYVVAVTYQFQEYLPYSQFAGIRTASALNRDRRSPLFGRIDLRSVVLAGHSLGAFNALHAADLVGLARRGVPPPPQFAVPPGARVVGALAIGPGTTITNAISVPTLVVSGTRDVIAAPQEARRSYDGISGAPAWFAVVDGATHLSVLDYPSSNQQIGIETAFLDFATRRGFCTDFAGSGWPGPGVAVSARNAPARAITCPSPPARPAGRR